MSARTSLVLVAGLVAVVAIAVVVSMGVGGEAVTVAVSDIGELLVVAASAAVVFVVASRFEPGEPVRLQWMLIGIGVLMFAVGDAVWAYLEVFRGVEPPYPGAPDVFYLLVYPFLAAGLIKAGLAYRGLVDLKRPAIVSLVVVLSLAVVLWVGLLKPSVIDAGVSGAEAAVSIGYPAGDLLLELGPAIFVALVVSQLGRGRFARPWWAVVSGVSLLAIADSGFSWLQAMDKYESGSVVDYGWSVGFLLIAVGASLAYDLAHPAAMPAGVPTQA